MNDIDSQAREACTKAAEYISTNGWYQNALYGPTLPGKERASACAVGAIIASVPITEDRLEAVEVQGRAVEMVANEVTSYDYDPQDLTLPAGYRVGCLFNDLPTTTAEDVILTLKKLGSKD